MNKGELQLSIDRSTEELEKIEHELEVMVNIDRKNWVNFYLLVKKVKEKELWKVSNAKSFTQWIKELSRKTKIHETIIWNRYKAGEVYQGYAENKRQGGENVKDITEVNVSPDSLVIVEKINKHAPEMASKLIDQVLKGELRRKDLVTAYEAIRPDKPNYNKRQKIEYIVSDDSETSETITDDEIKNKITAAKMVTTLSTMKWIGKESNDGFKGYRDKNKISANKNKARAFSEFAVYTGTSRKSRRIDVLGIENITKDEFEKHELNIHGIEIKVSKSDLVNDTKYTEYSEFVDYMWLAIPLDLVEDARNTKFSECGIIVVSENGETEIVEQATRLESELRHKTLTTALLKII